MNICDCNGLIILPQNSKKYDNTRLYSMHYLHLLINNKIIIYCMIKKNTHHKYRIQKCKGHIDTINNVLKCA